jgi:hypothetical protein
MSKPLPLFKATFVLKQESAGSIIFGAPSLEVARTIAASLAIGDIENWEEFSDEMSLEQVEKVEERRDV